jgi:hypothetical protein
MPDHDTIFTMAGAPQLREAKTNSNLLTSRSHGHGPGQNHTPTIGFVRPSS